MKRPRRIYRKDVLDKMAAVIAADFGEFCHRCYDDDVEAVELVPVEDGLWAVRIACRECGMSWGKGVNCNLFWREED